MYQGAKSKFLLFTGIAFLALALFSSPGSLQGQDNPFGNVSGNIYAQDGTTPLQGAVVKFKNITTGDFYESGKSDSRGFFELRGIEKGVYIYGVVTADGIYNSESLVGLNFRRNETAKLSIAVSPYSEEAMKTMEEFYNDLDARGESYVGRVVKFDASRMMAEVQLERGIIQVQDKIRDKGLKRDFTQNVKLLEREGAKVKRVMAGQMASIKMKKTADVDDMVFVVKKKSFLPWLWTPLGGAALIAIGGTAGYVTRVLLEEECEEVSPTKNKRK
jgi:hypothetical protein